MTQLTAWDFLPDNLRREGPSNELYPWLAPLIDWALPVSESEEYFTLDTLASQLGLDYTDLEAFSAYYNLMIRPVIGTRPAIDLAMKFIGVDARIIEWFEDTDNNLPPYKFVLELEEFPEVTDFGPLVDLILQLKNERSWLISIRMRGCDDKLYEHFTDGLPLNEIDGYQSDLGIIVCLFENHDLYIDFDATMDGWVQHSSHDLSYDYPYILLDAGEFEDMDWMAENDQPFSGVLWIEDPSLHPALFVNTNTFYQHTLSPQQLFAPRYRSPNTFYPPEVNRDLQTLVQAATLTNVNEFFSPTMGVTVAPALFTNTSIFYSPTIGGGTQYLTPALFVNTNVFYQHIIPPDLKPALFVNTNTFYRATVVGGNVNLVPALFVNTNTFPNHVIQLLGTGGTGSGGGGGGNPPACVAITNYLADGRPVLYAKVGDMIEALTLAGKGIRRVRIDTLQITDELCVRIRSASGGEVDVSTTTPVTQPDGSTVLVTEAEGKLIAVRDAKGLRWERIDAVTPIGSRAVAKIGAGGATFAAGRTPQVMLYTHNKGGEDN